MVSNFSAILFDGAKKKSQARRTHMQPLQTAQGAQTGQRTPPKKSKNEPQRPPKTPGPDPSRMTVKELTARHTATNRDRRGRKGNVKDEEDP